MQWFFIFLLFILCLFVGGFILVSWLRVPKQQWWLPFSLITFCCIFAGSWYWYMGEGAHIFYAEDDVNLQHIARLIESGTPLTPAMQQNMSHELQRQETRKSAEPTVWLLQGQLAMQDQNFMQAMQAYQLAYAYMPEDPDIAINYAQAMYLANNQEETPELKQLINTVQGEYPQHSGLLNLRAAMAYKAGQYAQAIVLWKELLTHYPPGSADAVTIQGAIENTQSKLTVENAVSQ